VPLFGKGPAWANVANDGGFPGLEILAVPRAVARQGGQIGTRGAGRRHTSTKATLGCRRAMRVKAFEFVGGSFFLHRLRFEVSIQHSKYDLSLVVDAAPAIVQVAASQVRDYCPHTLLRDAVDLIADALSHIRQPACQPR